MANTRLVSGWMRADGVDGAPTAGGRPALPGLIGNLVAAAELRGAAIASRTPLVRPLPVDESEQYPLGGRSCRAALTEP